MLFSAQTQVIKMDHCKQFTQCTKHYLWNEGFSLLWTNSNFDKR